MIYLARHHASERKRRCERGSVLIIVLWIALGLVSVALLFGHSMMFEYRAADNTLASLEASQAVESAYRYISFLLANLEEPGEILDIEDYEAEYVVVGNCAFWLLGRGDEETSDDVPVFSLVDESSKLNLNTATIEMLQALPGMTTQLAASIIDWRDTDSELTAEGAETENYLLREPAYNCKDSQFETIEELHLLIGSELDILYGEDMNRNGTLDPNENDGDLSLPDDNRNGTLDPGILEYVTIYSREPNTDSEGSERTNLKDDAEGGLSELYVETFGEERAREIQQAAGSDLSNINSVLEYYMSSGMTLDEFAQVADKLSVTDDEFTEGLVNVNTASKAVLACLPGIGEEYAGKLTAYRQGKTDELDTVGWVSEVLDEENAIQAGPYLTTKSYQFTADVAAVGHEGRGFRRTLFVIDTSEGEPAVVYRRDMKHLGWPLGAEIRNELRSTTDKRKSYR